MYSWLSAVPAPGVGDLACDTITPWQHCSVHATPGNKLGDDEATGLVPCMDALVSLTNLHTLDLGGETRHIFRFQAVPASITLPTFLAHSSVPCAWMYTQRMTWSTKQES